MNGLFSDSLWVPNITTGTIQLENCPVGYVVHTGNNAQEQECSRWTASVYVEVYISLSTQIDTFTTSSQLGFKRALSAISGISAANIMIARLSALNGRRLSDATIQTVSRLEADNVSAGAEVVLCFKTLDLNKYLALENLPVGLLVSISIVDTSYSVISAISRPIIIGICVGVLIFVLVCIGAGYFIFIILRKDGASKGVTAAFLSCKPGDNATVNYLPLKLRAEYFPEKVLGKGAFGYVLKARRIKEEKVVAIKIISPERGIFDEREMRHLRREERVLDLFTSLRCEHAVNFVGIGASKIKPGICWFVMEYLEGEDLQSIIRSKDEGKGLMDANECIKVARSILAALKVLHSNGMVHRDIKPANMMRCYRNTTDTRKNSRATLRPTKGRSDILKDGFVYKLIDFGTALGIDEAVAEEAMMTMNANRQMGAGTPPYMSPEMYTDPARSSYPTDLWSLGVSLFEIATGVLPFEAQSSLLWSMAVAGNMEEKAPSVLDLLDEARRAVFDHSLAKVIGKALEKKIEERYQSVDEMHEAVYSCLVENGEACYSAFISYRVASEAPLARLLFDELNHSLTPAGHRVTVFWDAQRLVRGQEWEDGFASGLLRSLCVLPLLSYGATAPLAHISGSRLAKAVSDGWEERPVGRQRLRGLSYDPEDNLLKEFLIALTLMERTRVAASDSARTDSEQGLLQAIYPILVGRQDPEGHPNYPRMGSFFSVQGGGGLYPEVPSLPTATAVASFLSTRACLPAEAVEGARARSVAAIMKGLTSVQGCQLWDHPVDLQEAPLTRGQMDLVGKGCAGPPVDIDSVALTPEQRARCAREGLDERQLRHLKAQVRHRLADIHELIDRAVFTAARADPRLRAMLRSSSTAPGAAARGHRRSQRSETTSPESSSTSTERSTQWSSATERSKNTSTASQPAAVLPAPAGLLHSGFGGAASGRAPLPPAAVATASLEISSLCDPGAALARVLQQADLSGPALLPQVPTVS